MNLGLDVHVISNGGTGITQKHIYGDAFEAMMGAVYLDQGYEFVNRLLINNIYFRFLNLEELTESESDFKSRLIEWSQKNRHQVEFRTEHDKEYASNHPVFYCTVLVDGMEVGPRDRGFEEGGRTACGVLRVAVHERRAVRFAAGQGRPSGRHPFRKRVLEGGGNPLHFRSCSAPARQMGIRTRFQTPSAGGCTGLPG